MSPFFNIYGRCVPGEHYMIPPQRRLADVFALIEGRRIFELVVPAKTGKTTSARWLVRHFNAGDRFCAIWVDVQDAREVADPAEAFTLVLDDLDLAVARDLPGLAPPSGAARTLEPARSSIRRYLHDLARRAPRPLLVLFDEVDGLVGEAMVSFLTQLRQGYIARTELAFPASVVLVHRGRGR